MNQSNHWLKIDLDPCLTQPESHLVQMFLTLFCHVTADRESSTTT